MTRGMRLPFYCRFIRSRQKFIKIERNLTELLQKIKMVRFLLHSARHASLVISPFWLGYRSFYFYSEVNFLFY